MCVSDKAREGKGVVVVGRGGGKESVEKRTLAFLFECQLSLFIIVFILPSTPIFASLLISRAQKKKIALTLAFIH